jgi:hypothetical protein
MKNRFQSLCFFKCNLCTATAWRASVAAARQRAATAEVFRRRRVTHARSALLRRVFTALAATSRERRYDRVAAAIYETEQKGKKTATAELGKELGTAAGAGASGDVSEDNETSDETGDEASGDVNGCGVIDMNGHDDVDDGAAFVVGRGAALEIAFDAVASVAAAAEQPDATRPLAPAAAPIPSAASNAKTAADWIQLVQPHLGGAVHVESS